MNRLNILIVDDERDARETLQLLIENFCNDVDIVAYAEDVPSAVKQLQSQQIDLVLLDIEMPVYSGFQLFDFIKNPSFGVIFTTAYDRFALKAFEVSAIDYLLKPIEADRLIIAIDKFRRKKAFQNYNERLNLFKESYENDNTTAKKIAIPVAHGFEFVKTEDIVYVQADGAYSEVHLVDERKIHLSKRLSIMDDLLGDSCFFRCNRSYIININHIKRFEKTEGGNITMSDDHRIPLSKDKKNTFEKLLSSITG